MGVINRTLIIKADYNDADYVTSEYKIDEIDELLIRKVANVILAKRNEAKENNRHWNYHNWDNNGYGRYPTPYELYKDVLTEEEISTFEDMCPYGPDTNGIHTIESIRIIEITKDEKVL